MALHYSIEENTEITKKFLLTLRDKSRRSGAWWKINHSERSLMHLAIKLRVKFASEELLRAISSVVKKLGHLLGAFQSALGKGARLAWLFSETACLWGNAEAYSWRYDSKYVEYLGNAFT